MPEYSFICSECDLDFSMVWTIREYDCKIKTAKCPECNSTKVYRDFAQDNLIVTGKLYSGIFTP